MPTPDAPFSAILFWNVRTLTSLHRIETPYAFCCASDAP